MEKINSQRNYKYFLLYFTVTIIVIFCLFLPLLNLLEWDIKIHIIALFGNSLIISIIIIAVVDLLNLTYSKKSLFWMPFLNMTLSITLFLLMIYCFVNDFFDIVYVWRHSNLSQPLVYKIVAIWAGQSGSIMTWMVFNSLVLFFYRFKTLTESEHKYDPVYILSCIFGLVILIIFLLFLFFQDPFQVEEPYILPEGSGLNPLLLSPFMIWHPFFTFIAYAIFLIPFSVIISESAFGIKRKIKMRLQNEESPIYKLAGLYQKLFFEFALKFGWLVMTLSIGFGAYWASVTISWGASYWTWDPVETVSLLPWIYCTAYFHSRPFRKSNSKLYKLNTILIFISVIFSTLVSRGGGINSLHTFVGTQELMFWVLLIGVILLIFTVYILDDVLSKLFGNFKNKRLFLDYLSYFFLFGLSFVLILGLFVPPLTYFIASFLPINAIYIGADYYNLVCTILASGLAISLIYCSIYADYKISAITKLLIVGIIIGTLLGLVINFVLIAIMIYFISCVASLISIIKHLKDQKGLKNFLRANSKKIIHLGISLILMGTLSGMLILTDIFFFVGFFVLLIGIIPSIVIVFVKRKMDV